MSCGPGFALLFLSPGETTGDGGWPLSSVGSWSVSSRWRTRGEAIGRVSAGEQDHMGG